MKKNNSNSGADKYINSINSDAVKKGVEKIRNMSEEDTKRLKQRIDAIDKDKVLKMLSSLSPETIKEKMASLDFSKLGELDKNNGILDKLKKDKR